MSLNNWMIDIYTIKGITMFILIYILKVKGNLHCLISTQL